MNIGQRSWSWHDGWVWDANGVPIMPWKFDR